MGMAVDNNTVVMKFDPSSLEIQFMWNISLNHHQVGDESQCPEFLLLLDFKGATNIDTINSSFELQSSILLVYEKNHHNLYK